MSGTRRTYRRNSPEAAARVIAALIARDGRLDWRELEFLDDVGTLQILGIERGRFMEVLSRYLGERLGGMAAGRSTQLIGAAMLLHLAEIDGVQTGEREFVRRAWERWNVTPQMIERKIKIPLARSRAVYEPVAIAKGLAIGMFFGILVPLGQALGA